MKKIENVIKKRKTSNSCFSYDDLYDHRDRPSMGRSA